MHKNEFNQAEKRNPSKGTTYAKNEGLDQYGLSENEWCMQEFGNGE